MIMEDAMIYHQDIPLKNKRINDYMQNIVSNNNNYKCECCPYGHHVNLDFVEFAKDISNSHNELQKIRRYQRKLERVQNNLLNKSDACSNFPKESLILSNQLSCSSSDSNSSEVIESRAEQLENKCNKSQLNDVVHIPNNLNNCTFKFSDDKDQSSPDCNDSGKNQFKTISSTKSSPKNSSYSSKSFVVSYEHLMSIREQMSTSLKRVQDLENEVKNIYNLRQRIDQITKENHHLKIELMNEKELNERSNNPTELTRKINEIAQNWSSITDLPNQILPNLERIMNTKIPSSSISLKSKPSQTDVSGSIIIDTMSHFTQSARDVESQISSEDNIITKIRKKNFGVTVRPTQHHFSNQFQSEFQQLFMEKQSMEKFVDWLKSCSNEIDQRMGVVIYNLMSHLISNSYEEAIDLLKTEIQSNTNHYRSNDSKYSQTTPVLSWDVSSQANIPTSQLGKCCQISPDLCEKSTHMQAIEMRDCSVDCLRVTSRDIPSQTGVTNTFDKSIQTDQVYKSCQDFNNYYKHTISHNHTSSSTDRHLIDDMIAEQIERSIEIIHQELRIEVAQSAKQQQHLSSLNDLLTNEMMQSTDSIDTEYLELRHSPVQLLDCPINAPQCPLDSHQIHSPQHGPTVFKSPIVHTSISGQSHSQSNLKRGDIIYSHFTNEDPSYRMSNEARLNESSVVHSNEDLKSDPSNSASSSPMEATYYSNDGRVDYCSNNRMEDIEDVNEIEEDQDTKFVQKLSTIIPNGDSKPVFPPEIQEACKVIALWMNDSTTTCSKDLNESLAIIRQFWFEITADAACDLKFYIEKFSSFNPTLQERFINMTDSNGNTCLHYAVSEGRWKIVRLLLQTRQVNVNKTNNAGYTVLMLVAVSENIDEESLKMLINDSQIDKQSVNDTKQTALMIAASQGKTLLVQLLLEKGASVNITDSDGSTALMCACDNGHLEVVRLLLSKPDIDTEIEDNTGCNAMKIALDNSHKDIALLIFARNNLPKISQKSKRRSGSSSHPTSPLNQRKFK